MDAEKWPELHLFPTLEKLKAAAHVVGRVITLRAFLPEEAPDYMSEHYRGGAAMLDRELYDKQEQRMTDYWGGLMDAAESMDSGGGFGPTQPEGSCDACWALDCPGHEAA